MATLPKGFIPDPDQELPEGFVRDETEEEAGLRESFLDKKKFKPSRGQRALPKAPIDELQAEREANRATTPRGYADFAAGAANSALDRYSMGGYGLLLRAADAISNAAGAEGPTPASAALEGMQHYRGMPNASSFTDAPVYAVRGPVTALANGVSRAADAGMRAIPGASGLGRGMQRLLPTIGTSAGTGATITASHAASEGAAPEDVLEAALQGGAAGGAIAMPIGMGASMLGRAGQAIANSKGGQARQFIERHGGEVGPTTPGRGGPFDDMVTLGSDDAAIGQQAEASSRRGLEMLREKIPAGTSAAELSAREQALRESLGRRADELTRNVGVQAQDSARQGLTMLRAEKSAEVSRPYGEALREIKQSGQASELRDVRPIYSKLTDTFYDPSVAPEVAAKVKRLMDIMDQRYARADGSIMMTEEHLNGLRRSLNRMGKVGQSTDEALSPLQEAAREAQRMTQIGPYQEANRAYAEGSQRFQRSRRLLGLSERSRTPAETRAAEDSLARRLERRSSPTGTAARHEDDLADFESRHPDIAREFEKPTSLRRSGESQIEADRLAGEGQIGAMRQQRQTFAEENLYPLGLRDIAEGEIAPSVVDRVRNIITRRGQNTVTAGGQRGRLAQFEERHPEIAEEFIKPELLRKRADIGFHLLPSHGGLIDRVAMNALGLPALAYKNLPAISARFLYGPALAAQAAEPLILGELPLLAAARNAQGLGTGEP